MMMKLFRNKRPANMLHPTLRVPMYIALGVIAVLIGALICTSVRLSGSEAKASAAQIKLAGALRSEANLLWRTYEKTQVDRYDLKGSLVPDMRKYLYSASLLNTALANGYGAEAAPLDDALLTSAASALDSIERALDQSGDAAKAVTLLGTYLEKIRDATA